MNVYRGRINEVPLFNGERCEVTINGEPLPLCLEIYNHSPTGFEWGYLGSGPAQLALAIMVAEYGRDLSKHPIYYQFFKSLVIAALPMDQGWELTSDVINAAINQQRQN